MGILCGCSTAIIIMVLLSFYSMKKKMQARTTMALMGAMAIVCMGTCTTLCGMEIGQLRRTFSNVGPVQWARTSHTRAILLYTLLLLLDKFRLVDELVNLMSEENLETLDYDGFSALTEAAVGGKLAMAQCMLSKNKKLISIASSTGILPVNTAISYGHIKTARYLYSLTPREDLMREGSYDGANLFIDAISTGTLGNNSYL